MIGIKEIFSLIVSIVGIILVLFFTYYCTKWLSKRTNIMGKSNYIQIVDKIFIGQNQSLTIVKIEEKYYLLGIGEKNITLIKEFEEFSEIPTENNFESLDFKKMLSKIMKKEN